MILPAKGFQGDSDGEELIWRLFSRELPKHYISFHGYRIGVRKPDIILLVPDQGVLIIENKSIRAKSIAGVPNNNLILMHHKPQISSPLKQADGCGMALLDEVLKPAGVEQVMVLPAVAYPYISEPEFTEKQLDKISARAETFLREDLQNFETIQRRIDAIFQRGYEQIHVPTISKGGFNLVLMDQTANLISPHYKDQEPAEQDHPPTSGQEPGGTTTSVPPASGQGSAGNPGSTPPVSGQETGTTVPQTPRPAPIIPLSYPVLQPDYSILLYSKTGDVFTPERIAALTAAWQRGTKLFLYTENGAALETLEHAFSECIAANNLPEEKFALRHHLSFRLELGQTAAGSALPLEALEIRNGEHYEVHDAFLKALDKASSFNYGQYQMEHATCGNIKVTAGAGTGKTHTMVSRINYLIWKEQVEPEELARFLVMITFTNKSADEMKHKLFEYFLSFYQLTRKTKYFEYLEAVEDMQISTIHSLCRTILGKFGSRLGLGKEFRITTGTYRRREILREEMDRWLAQHPDGAHLTKMKLYYLQKRMEELLDKIDNKNVDLVHDREKLDFGTGDSCMPDSLIDVLTRTQERLDSEMTENNSVCLKSMIRKMGELCDQLTEADFPRDHSIRYLFVDEFQDTDNVQIELIQRFQKLAGFFWFVVGDTKQCIYRFRGADDEAFKRLTDGSDCISIALQKNYRTDRALLEQMNQRFEAWHAKGNITYTGEEVLTGVKELPTEEAFEVIPCGKTPDDNTLLGVIREAESAVKARDGRAAILVRNNYQIQSILDLCRRNQISIGTEVGGRLFQSDPTIDLYKLAQALKYPEEPEYLFNLYTTSYMAQPLRKQELIGKNQAQQVAFFEATCGIPEWQKYVQNLKTEPVMQVLQSLVQKCHPWDRFAELMNQPDKKEKNKNYYMRNLDQIFENLIQIGNTDYLTINKITDYLEIMIVTHQEAEEREAFEEAGGEERLICTTVHKAKGMEYDTVILPYCSLNITNTITKGNVDVIFDRPKVAYRVSEQEQEPGSSRGTPKPDAFHNDYYDDIKSGENRSREREETRILYVAMTRAIRKLVCFVPGNTSSKMTTWGMLIKEGLA